MQLGLAYSRPFLVSRLSLPSPRISSVFASDFSGLRMVAWSEIEQIRKDPDGVRGMARRLSALGSDGGLTDWEADFLENLQRQKNLEEYSTRQAEKLLEIRGDIELVEECRGFSVRRLISECFEGRLELSEDDEAWIVELKSEGSSRIRRRHIGRLLRCAREVGAIHAGEA